MNDLALKQKRPRGYSKHGLTTLKRGVNALGSRVIDKRTTLAKSLAKWRLELVNDLGGQDSISTQQAALIDLTVKSKLADGFARYLSQLGLERRHKVKTLHDILTEGDEQVADVPNGKA